MRAPTERHLEDWIVANPLRFGDEWDVSDLSEDYWRGRYRVDENAVIEPYFGKLIARQLRLPNGRVDLIGEADVTVSAIEIKKDAITYATIGQCLRYMYDLSNIFGDVYLQSTHPSNPESPLYTYPHTQALEVSENFLDEVSGMVIGHGFEDRNIPIVAATCGIAVVTYDYDADRGYTFERHYIQYSGTPSAYKDFAYGAVGDAMRNVMKFRAAWFTSRMQAAQDE